MDKGFNHWLNLTKVWGNPVHSTGICGVQIQVFHRYLSWGLFPYMEMILTILIAALKATPLRMCRDLFDDIRWVLISLMNCVGKRIWHCPPDPGKGWDRERQRMRAATYMEISSKFLLVDQVLQELFIIKIQCLPPPPTSQKSSYMCWRQIQFLWLKKSVS